MASPTLKELKYRTFDDLMNEVYGDLPALTREGLVEPAQLIKIAQRVNNEIGLKIHGTKETILEVEHGRAKLPSDFHILNLALLCHHHISHSPGLFNGIHTEDVAVPILNPNSIPQLTTCPCWNIVNNQQVDVQTKYVDCSGVAHGLVVPAGATLNICAISVENIPGQNQQQSSQGSGPSIAACTTVQNNESTPQLISVMYFDGTTSQFLVPPNSVTCYCAQHAGPADPNNPSDITFTTIGDCYSNTDNWCCSGSALTITTSNFCYNDPVTGTFTCSPAQASCCISAEEKDTCAIVNADPWKQNRVYTTCNNTMEVNVIEYRSDEIREYRSFDKIHMKPSKEASAFCVNTQFDDARHEGFIRDGYLFVPTLHHEGHHGRSRVYICYLGAMEDEEGNLLVLDHPKINEFYEWALKARVFENMYLNGEPDIENRLKLAKSELKTARAEALSIVTMPDFYELKKAVEINRKAMYAKYLHPFSSLYGNTPGWPGAYNTDHL